MGKVAVARIELPHYLLNIICVSAHSSAREVVLERKMCVTMKCCTSQSANRKRVSTCWLSPFKSSLLLLIWALTVCLSLGFSSRPLLYSPRFFASSIVVQKEQRITSTKQASDDGTDETAKSLSKPVSALKRVSATTENKLIRNAPNRPSNGASKRPLRRNTPAGRRGSPGSSILQNSKRLNQLLVACESASEVLTLLQNTKGSLTQKASGGTMNSVNFSTSIHRLCRHSLNQRDTRAATLADPRFALLLASTAEAMVTMPFQSRELSNIGWALAKLKIVPPLTAMPFEQSDDEALKAAAQTVRDGVFKAAKERQESGTPSKAWITALSQLAGQILDRISQNVVSTQTDGFRLQEWANLMWAWATAERADPVAFGVAVDKMIDQQQEADRTGEPNLRPQEWTNSVWAFATAQVYGKHEKLLIFVAELMEREYAFVQMFKPQELSNTVWGVATLLSNKEGALTDAEQEAALSIVRIVSKALLKRSNEFKTQELSNTLWAFATLGFGLKSSGEQSLNNYVVLASNQFEEDRELMQQAVEAVVLAAYPQLDRFRSQELNNLAWALARLVDHKSALVENILRGIGMQLCDRKRFVTPQDIGATIWSLATLEFFDEEIYRGIAFRLTPDKGGSCKPQELSNIVWAIATAEVQVKDRDAFDTTLVPESKRQPVRDPITRSFAIAATELMRRPSQFKSQEIKDILWAFSKIGIRHPSLFKSVSEHLVGIIGPGKPRGLTEFSPQGLGNTAWAFARQAQLSEEAANRLGGASLLPSSNGRLAIYTACYFDIGEELIHRLFAAIAEAGITKHVNLTSFKPQDLSNTAWTFAVLGLRHTAFMEVAMHELERRLSLFLKGERTSITTFKGQELANLLWALATLNIRVENSLEIVTPYLQEVCFEGRTGMPVQAIAQIFKRQELANVAWSCAVFGKYPTALMQLLYAGLIGLDKECDAEKLSNVYGDKGLQSQALMSLIYVQASMDRAGKSTLGLPPNFPDAWRQSTPSEDGQRMTETNIELSLSTSKIQRDVSAAFNRIGFKHIEEHTISMQEMVVEYGVNFAPQQLDILSIDIANVPEKIAIEVDGPAHFINLIDNVDENDYGSTKAPNGKLEYQFQWTGDRQMMNGSTSLKHRLLESLGWRVIHIPFWEWYQMGSDEEQGEYCRDALDTLGE